MGWGKYYWCVNSLTVDCIADRSVEYRNSELDVLEDRPSVQLIEYWWTRYEFKPLSVWSARLTSLGPLVLVALIYMLIGFAIAWVIKLSFWIPHRFRYGILVAGGWANLGDIRKLNELAVYFQYLTLTCISDLSDHEHNVIGSFQRFSGWEPRCELHCCFSSCVFGEYIDLFFAFAHCNMCRLRYSLLEDISSSCWITMVLT